MRSEILERGAARDLTLRGEWEHRNPRENEMKSLVIGASGFVGRHLVRALRERGDGVAVTGRSLSKLQKTFRDGVRVIEWDPNAGSIPPEALAGVDVVINLAGDNVAKGRWSKRKKERIPQSCNSTVL